MPDTRLVAIPDTDGELVLWLDRLEDLLITLSPLPGDPEDWEPPAPPLGDGSALAALQRLSAAVHDAERTAPPALIPPDERFELVPLRFVAVDPADTATVANGLAALGLATLAGGDELVADALAEHAHHRRLAVADFVAGCTRAHAVLDQVSDNGSTLLARGSTILTRAHRAHRRRACRLPAGHGRASRRLPPERPPRPLRLPRPVRSLTRPAVASARWRRRWSAQWRTFQLRAGGDRSASAAPCVRFVHRPATTGHAMTDTPTSTTTGGGDGHALYRTPETAELSPEHDSLLVTPVGEMEFPGSPYPAPGARVVGTGGNPPWLVVQHYLDRIGLAGWPVRLWRVGDIDAAPPGAQQSDWYTRVFSANIVEEVSAWLLFGEHGAEVARVIEAAQDLRQEDAVALAANRPDRAGSVYAEVWRRWQSPARWGSPVGHTLILTHNAVERSAKNVAPSVFRYDPIDEVDLLVERTWIVAQAALLEAALGLGAPHLMNADETAVLTTAWHCWPTL